MILSILMVKHLFKELTETFEAAEAVKTIEAVEPVEAVEAEVLLKVKIFILYTNLQKSQISIKVNGIL